MTDQTTNNPDDQDDTKKILDELETDVTLKEDSIENSYFRPERLKAKSDLSKFKFIDFASDKADSEKESADKNNTLIESESKWEVIFTDLVALLLTFFVMLIASSHIDETRWYKVVSSLEGEMKSTIVGATSYRPSQRTLVPKNQVDNYDMEYYKKILETKISSSLLLDEVDVISSPKGVLLTIPKGVIFRGFSHEISNKGKNMLEELSEILHNLDMHLSIETMTAYDNDRQTNNDTSILHKKREISLMRSDSIRTFLINNGYDNNIVIMGSATKVANSDREKVIFFIEKK